MIGGTEPFDLGLADTRDGVRIAYRRYGDESAPVVFAVHGFASNAQVNWVDAGWIRALTEAGHQVTTVDLRGHGQSDKPHDAASYELETVVEDLVAVLDVLGLDRVDYLGYSLGARLGWELGVRHPERVRTLVLGGLPDAEPLINFNAAAALAHKTTGAEIPDDFTRSFVAMIDGVPGNDPQALYALAAGLRTEQRTTQAARPQQPALFVTGDRDDIAESGTGLAAVVPDGRFLSLPGRTHVNAVSARAFKNAVLEFLSDHPA